MEKVLDAAPGKDKVCRCGSKRFEKVDIATSGEQQSGQFFIRCRKCGLVVYSATNSGNPDPHRGCSRR